MKCRCQSCAHVFLRALGRCPKCDWIVGQKVPTSPLGGGEPAPMQPQPTDVQPQPRLEVISGQTPLQALESLFHDFAMRLLGLCGQLELMSEAIENLKKEQTDGAGPTTPDQCPAESSPGKSEVVAQPQGDGSPIQEVARNVGDQDHRRGDDFAGKT